MNQPLKGLISARAKKFIVNHLLQTLTYFKGTQQFTGFFPNHDWLGHTWPPFVIGDCAKKVTKCDKANHGWEKTL